MTEALIQRAIIDRCRWANVLCVAVPNEGKRSPVTAQRMKARGMRPGFPDLICMQRGLVAFLEVKAAKGRVSDNQVEMHEEIERHGLPVAVVRSQDEAAEFLRAQGFDI
jgi:hypothetical protein